MGKMTLIAGAFVCSIQLAHADVQLFVNDYSGFAAAAGPLSVIDFETQPNGQPSQPGVQVTAAYNYDSYGVHFSMPAGRLELAGNPISGFHLDAIIPQPVPSSRTWIVADPLEPVFATGGHFGGDSYLFAYDFQGQLIDYVYYWFISQLRGTPRGFLGRSNLHRGSRRPCV